MSSPEEFGTTHAGANARLVIARLRSSRPNTYFAGRTSTCMKLSRALMLWMRICVPVFGVITLPRGFAGS